ncbi:MAG: HupE/UreJ family protein [Chromatiales bacterium]
MISLRRYASVPALAALPATSWAHSPIKGIGSFYNGILHPLLEPAHLLALLTLGLLLGMQRGRHIKTGIPLFMLTLAATLLAVRFGITHDTQAWLLSATLLVGLLVVVARPLPDPAYLLLAACFAVLLGLDSGQPSMSSGQLTGALYGSGLGASLLLIYAAGLAEYLQKPWQQILTRVLASWSSASALLVLAFLLTASRQPVS